MNPKKVGDNYDDSNQKIILKGISGPIKKNGKIMLNPINKGESIKYDINLKHSNIDYNNSKNNEILKKQLKLKMI